MRKFEMNAFQALIMLRRTRQIDKQEARAIWSYLDGESLIPERLWPLAEKVYLMQLRPTRPLH